MVSFRIWCLTLPLIVALTSGLVCAGNTSSCPAWFYFRNSTKKCHCGHFLRCDSPHTAKILEGYCATTAGKEDKYYIGTCPYSHIGNETDRLHTEMPDPEMLDEVMCGPYNRKGLLCGECKEGHGPVLYQYDKQCAKCSQYSVGYGFALYTALELIPITLVFICMIIFHLDVTSGPLFGYFIFWQLGTIVLSKYVFVLNYLQLHVTSMYFKLLSAGVILGQFVTMNFVVVPFCISGNLKEIHVQMLTLFSASYPVILVIITCILIELHARNCRIIHILWKPFSIILNKTNLTAVASDAVIHAFASFIFLSYLTVYYAMANVLTSTIVKRIYASESFYVLYIDPTIKWLSQEHIVYVVIVAVPFTIVTLIPSLLLIVYPTRLYSRYLSRCLSARKRLAIMAFAEALHKCFKDGLDGTIDCRAIPGLILVIPVLFVLFKDVLGECDPDSSIAAVLFQLLLMFVVTYVKPCKTGIANFSLCFHLLLLTLLAVVYHLWLHALYVDTKWLMVCFAILPLSSHVLVLTWTGYRIIHRIMWHFGYEFKPSGCKMALIDLASAVQHRRRRGYYALM